MSDKNTPDVANLTGTTLAGRYRIGRCLGVGGMGAVYIGEHLRMGRSDAIKVLRAELARDPEAVARFTRGAQAVARLRHPNVCQLYDFGETEDGLLFLAMEFIEGPSLSGLLADEGRLAPDRAIRFIRQAGDALQHAHDEGIVHRDLKPDNLMIARGRDGSEQLKVVDFDIARGTEESGAGVTRQGFVVGTPEYMSPEQLTGDALDPRSDLYSLALVLFRCLTGRLPFEGTTAQEVMIQRLNVEPLRLSQAAPGRSFPTGLEAVVHRALSKLPDERHGSIRDFVQAVADTSAPAGAPIGRGAADPDATRVAPASAPAADATRVAQEIPSTHVVGGAHAATRRGPRRAGLVAAVAVVVSGLVGAGWLVLGSRGDLPADPPRVAADSMVELAGTDATPDAGAAPADPGTERAPGRTTTGRAGAGGSAAGTERGPIDEQPGPSPPATTATAMAGVGTIELDVDLAEVQGLLFRQFVLQAEAVGRRPIEAARDTAAAVWVMPGVSRSDSAFAANVLGLALIALGDSSHGVGWLERAVELEPLERYRRALEGHRRLRR